MGEKRNIFKESKRFADITIPKTTTISLHLQRKILASSEIIQTTEVNTVFFKYILKVLKDFNAGLNYRKADINPTLKKTRIWIRP